MICICLGPTKLLDPARRLITPPAGPDAPGLDDNGVKPVWEHAGIIQVKLHDALGGFDTCEHGHGVQHRADGVWLTAMRQETAEQRYYRRMRENGIEEKVIRRAFPFKPDADPFNNEPVLLLAANLPVKRPQAPECYGSDALNAACGGMVDLSWFPDGFSFGNGVTTNSWVPLTNPTTGERKTVLLSWCVLSPATAARHKADAGVRRAVISCMES